MRLLKILSQHDTEAHFIPTLSKFDPEAASDIVASNIGTEASNTLTYYFQAVCSIYLISLSLERDLLCMTPGVIAAICLLESSFIGEQLLWNMFF